MTGEQHFLLAHGGAVVAIAFRDDEVGALLGFLFRDAMDIPTNKKDPVAKLRIGKASDGWALETGSATFRADHHRLVDLALPLMNTVLLQLAAGDPSRIHLHAALVSTGSGSILLPGLPGCGKTAVSLFLCRCGYRYHGDELVSVDRRNGDIVPLTRPLGLRTSLFDSLTEAGNWLSGLAMADVLHSAHNVWIAHRAINPDYRGAPPLLRAMVFPQYDPRQPPELTPASAARSGMSLMQSQFKSATHEDHGFETISGLVRSLPLYRLRYQHPEEVAELMETV